MVRTVVDLWSALFAHLILSPSFVFFLNDRRLKIQKKNLLVNFTPSLSDSLLFGRMTWLVICGELYDVLAACCRHKGSWVPNIDYVAEIINDNQNDCTWAAAIKLVLSAPRKSFNSVQEILIGLLVGIDDSLLRVLGKLLISYDKLM
jgi:hypothetical protein